MSLKDDLVRIINRSHLHTWATFRHVQSEAAQFGLDVSSVAKWRSPGEPALVYGLVDDWTLSSIASAIQKHMPSHTGQKSAIISPIFIHQKPKVRFNGNSEVEIGDLLLVRQHFRDGSRKSEGRAILVQAKVAGKSKTGTLKGNELVQFKLYNGWGPQFSFPYKEVKGRMAWNFWTGSPKDLSETGVYAVGYKHEKLSNRGFAFPDDCAWAVGKVPYPGVKPQIDASVHSLATVLDDFVHGLYGRPWSPVPMGDVDHWSDFVTQMLAVSTGWAAPLQRLGKKEISRLRPDVVFQHVAPALWMTTHSIEYRYLRWDERRPYVNRKLADLTAWAGSNEGTPPEAPGDSDAFQPRGRKGISILYVATFGERPLGMTE
jgi:hypothetical protein